MAAAVVREPLAVVAVATHNGRYLPHLKAACRRNRLPLVLLGEGQTFTGYSMKLHLLLDALPGLIERYAHVLYVDGFDTIVLAGADALLERYREFGAPLVASAEKNCLPPELADRYPSAPTAYRYLNTGGLMGTPEALLRFLEAAGARDVPATVNDQEYLGAYYCDHPESLALDHGCRLFQVMVWADYEVLPDPPAGLYNRVTNTRPLVVHGAGQSDLRRPIIWAGLDRDAPLSKTRLGIGITTYRRPDSLAQLVRGIRAYTETPFEMVIADDGSDDGTVEWCRAEGLRVVTGPNRGCAWNKNRALAYLLEYTDCDPILLLEDDCRIWEAGWDADWVRAAQVWGHINWSHQPRKEAAGGDGTPEDPFRFTLHLGCCTISTREALQAVGYVDTRFVGYGWEHREWTRRFARHLAETWGAPTGTTPCLTAHVGVEFRGSNFNQMDFDLNRRMMDRLFREPIYRPPARTAVEALALARELEAVLGPEGAP